MTLSGVRFVKFPRLGLLVNKEFQRAQKETVGSQNYDRLFTVLGEMRKSK